MEIYFACPHNGPTEDLCLSLSRYQNGICVTCMINKLAELDRHNATLKFYSTSIALESVSLLYQVSKQTPFRHTGSNPSDVASMHTWITPISGGIS